MSTPEVPNLTPVVIDRNGLWFPQAIEIVSRAYCVFSKTPLDPSEVRADLLDDSYSCRSVYVGTLANNQLSGVVRVVFGSDNPSDSTLALEAMQLLDIPELRQKVSLKKAAEFTRFTINPEFTLYKLPIMRQFYKTAREEVLIPKEITEVYAVMPPYMHRIITQASIPVVPLTSSLRSDLYSLSVYQKYPLYWNLNPQAYRFSNYP